MTDRYVYLLKAISDLYLIDMYLIYIVFLTVYFTEFLMLQIQNRRRRFSFNDRIINAVVQFSLDYF